MSTPEPELPWYQFRLRSLLLLMLYVAVLCSLGVISSWFFAGLTGLATSLGGIIGRIVARTKLGLVVGALLGISGLTFSLLTLPPAYLQLVGFEGWQVVCWIAALLGGVLGGVSGGLWMRFHSRRATHRTDKQEAERRSP